MEVFTLNDYIFAFLLTFFAGISTSIGAVLAFFSKDKNYTFLSFGLGFSAGVMIYVSFMEILVKSKLAFFDLYQNEVKAEIFMLIFFFAGMIFSAMIDKFVPKDVNPHEVKNDWELSVLKKNSQHSVLDMNKLKRTGTFTAIAIAIHNFPEGFATFTAALENPTLGISIAIAIAIHNIPEGMSVSLPIYYSTKNRKKAFKYATFSGLAEPIGAIVGFFVLYPFLNESALGMIFAFVAGIMIFISLDELLPASKVYGKSHVSILGLLLGMLVMASSLIAFKI